MAAWIIAWWIKSLPPYERDFSLNDVLISHKHRKNQYVCLMAEVYKYHANFYHLHRISGNTNMLIALLVPGATVIAVGTLRASAMEIHHGLLSLWAGRYSSFCLSGSLTDI